MKNPYFNTMWSERDEAFLVTGQKQGFAVGAFLVSMVSFGIWGFYQEYKEKKQKKK